MAPGPSRDDAVVKLLKHLFHGLFVEEEQIPAAAKPNVLPRYFFTWLHKKEGLLDVDSVCSAAGVGREVWEFVFQMLDGGHVVEQTENIWYSVCLGDRPPPTFPVRSLNLVLLLTYEDGTIMPISTFVSPEMMLVPAALDDATVASVIRQNAVGAFLSAITERGLDGLHAQGTNYRGGTQIDPYDAFCGMNLKALREGFKDGKIADDLRPWIEQYVRLAQAIIRPLVPPQVRAQIAQARAARAAAAENPATDKPVTGGWNVG